MNYAQYLEKGKTIESTESLIEKVINSQGQDENALQELVNRAQSQDSKAIEFLQMLQQQSGVSKFEEPSGPIVKKDQQDPNMPVAAETGTVDGRKYTYMPYQGEGRGPIDRFEYVGQDGNTYGMTIQGPDTTYVMNGQQYNDPEGQRVIKERRAAVVREKCGGSVKKKETGDKITRKKVMAKGGCPCMIKKVGGRLIEVDSCTGLPVHRNGGMVKKYQNAAGGIKRADNGTYYFEAGPSSRTYTAAEAKERLGAVRYDGNYYYRDPSGKIYTQKSTPLNWAQSAGWSEVDRNERGAYQLPSQVLTDLGQQKRANGSWGYGAAPAAPAQPAQTAPSAPEQTAQPVSPVQPAPTQQPAAPSTPGLFTGDLRSYGARKQWVSDNAEYLKSQGWDDARIAGYRGSAADNIELQKAISGKAAWDQEQAQNAEFARQRELDRQKQLAFENEMANSRSVDATGYRSKPVRTQPLTMQERYSQLTPWEREQITFSNDQLKSMNPAQALYLPKMQYDQYLNLKFNR